MTDETRPDREALRRIEALADDLVDRLGGLQGLLSADLEGAYQSGQSLAQKNYISDLMGRANAAWGAAVTIREAAAGRSMPSFEDLLRDPTGQFDPNSVVLKSVLDYQQRLPGQQQEFCLAPIRLAAPTTAGTALPPTGSVYVCTNPKPCADHPSMLAAAPALTQASGCPRCGHAPHQEPCLNMASDNECSCPGVPAVTGAGQ